jgi:pimeloyl-ACP methyl ester carboxylesterase
MGFIRLLKLYRIVMEKQRGIGHSYGAGQLMIYASVYPEYVKELILLDSMAYMILPAEHAIHQLKATGKKRLQIEHCLEQNKPMYLIRI